MAILKCVDKELLTSDKELSVLVYLELRNNMIEKYKNDIIHVLCSIEINNMIKKYKDDIIHVLCSIEISCNKRTIIHIMD